MQALTVYGKSGAGALEKREDLSSYHLQVEWADAQNRWRESRITLPTGRQVALVGAHGSVLVFGPAINDLSVFLANVHHAAQ